MPAKKFTEEEMILLRQNPNILHVSSTSLSYSLEFKQKAVECALQKNMTSTKFFASEGLDPAILGKSRIYAAMKAFKREAASPEGLRQNGKSKEARMEAFAKQDLSKKQTKTAIRELQEKVIHLEQQIEFLKKTQNPPT